VRPGAELDVAPPLELERIAGGGLVAIRTAEAYDAALLRDLVLEQVRAQRRARPFGRFAPSHRVPRRLAPLTTPAALEECLLAIEPRSGRALGMAALGPPGDDPTVAAPWMLVRAGFRRRGIGTALLERLVERARGRHLERFQVRVVVSEQRMLELMRGVGVSCRPLGNLREVDADVPIGGGDGLGVALGAALWAVARGGLVPMPPAR
jgi:GNAT superfamily N-acetyltransferase